MPVQGTIMLDSGAILQEISPGYFPELVIGYFQSDDGVSDLQVFANGEPTEQKPVKLAGKIEIRHNGASGRGAEVTRGFADTLLKLEDLYGPKRPTFKEDEFDSKLSFKSGRFCASLVKQRAFKPHGVNDPVRLVGTPKTPPKLISHNIAVHYDLEDEDTLELVNSNGDVLFTTRDLPEGTKRFEIELIADNTTAVRFYHKAIDLTDCETCWLPNQGDPPPMGPP